MIALSEIAGEDIFGRGNGYMSVSPILAVVRDIHSSAGESTNCPLNSKIIIRLDERQLLKICSDK